MTVAESAGSDEVRYEIDSLSPAEREKEEQQQQQQQQQEEGDDNEAVKGEASNNADTSGSSDATEHEKPSDEPVADSANSTSGAELGRVSSQAQRLGKKKIIVIMGALCMVLFLAALDMTIVSTALPTMAAHFHATESGYSWMASSYLLANASCIPLWGKLSDVFGRKPIILLANLAFLAGSLLSALANSLAMIIGGRAVQGVGGGGIIVLANICVSDLFSARDRPLFYALFGATWAIAGALGPIVGGAFTTSVTWRWCFYLNLPIGGFSFVILLLLLKVESEKTPLLLGLRSIDWVGTLLVIGGTLMFLFGLEFGGVRYPWSSQAVVCLIVFGVFTWTLFLLNEWKLAKYPIIPTRLFDNLHNVLMLLISYCHGFVFIAGSYYLPFYFQTVLLATPIQSGVYVLPQVVSLAITSAGTGVVIKKTGRYREVITGGLFFLTLGFSLFTDLQPYASWPRIILFQMIAGIGIGPIFQAPLVAFQANIHPSDVAAATATFGFVRQISTSMSVVLGTVVYQNILKTQLPYLRQVLLDSSSSITTPAAAAAEAARLVHSFAGTDKSFIEKLPPPQRNAVLAAFTYTLRRMWILYACVGGLGFLLSLFIRPVELSKTHVARPTGLAEQERARLEILHAKRSKARAKKLNKENGNDNTQHSAAARDDLV